MTSISQIPHRIFYQGQKKDVFESNMPTRLESLDGTPDTSVGFVNSTLLIYSTNHVGQVE